MLKFSISRVSSYRENKPSPRLHSTLNRDLCSKICSRHKSNLTFSYLRPQMVALEYLNDIKELEKCNFLAEIGQVTGQVKIYIILN